LLNSIVGFYFENPNNVIVIYLFTSKAQDNEKKTMNKLLLN